ncbi:MAG: hypothetical protein AVDCRST_MAG68-5400 [uncultured Gemmatimonadetes bacterium]|uniref:Uncharacterized protein n=1 Tax=uncultured Gemmatimonadota bacterium TaxID=203437 RepID=A0A6J4MV99_9BACT|nr:MAG: hypothetical protein AVDCRST_MAG68-5400 [uncultured Gemmatimonadota bacterium]
MRYTILALLLCAACARHEPGADGAPASAEQAAPTNPAVQADSARSDVTGPNGPRTGG